MNEANWIEPCWESPCEYRAWLLALAASALIFMFPLTADPYQTPRLALLAAICIPLLLRKSSSRSSLVGPSFLFFIIWCACSIVSSDRSYSLTGSALAPFDGLTAAAVYLAVLIGVSRLNATMEDAGVAICWSSLPVSVYAIFQRVFTDPLLPIPLPGGRVIATQGSAVYLGAVLAIVFAVAAALLAGPRRRLAVATLALCAPALWFTGTRGAILAAALAAFALTPGRARWAILAVLALHPRARTLGSDVGRIEIWREAWKVFRAHPLMGSGPGTFELASRAHITAAYISSQGNAYAVSQSAHDLALQILATTGVIGAIGAAVLGIGAFAAWKGSSGQARRILGGSGVAFLVVSAFNPAPHAAVVLMIILFGVASSGVSSAPEREYTVAALALASVLVSSRVMAGDWHALRASRAHDPIESAEEYALASEANPWETRLVAKRVDSALLVAVGMSAEDRRTVASACLEWSSSAVRRHPNDPLAHEVLGKSILAAYTLGIPADPHEALAEFNAAQKLAPTFPPLMQRRLALARALGDSAEVVRAGAEIERSRALMGGI